MWVSYGWQMHCNNYLFLPLPHSLPLSFHLRFLIHFLIFFSYLFLFAFFISSSFGFSLFSWHFFYCRVVIFPFCSFFCSLSCSLSPFFFPLTIFSYFSLTFTLMPFLPFRLHISPFPLVFVLSHFLVFVRFLYHPVVPCPVFSLFFSPSRFSYHSSSFTFVHFLHLS